MKGLLKFITCGSVDDGKSTLIGHILYDAKLLYADQEKALELDSKVGSRGGEIDYSLLLDGLIAEREQGITIDVAYRYFTTDNRSFIVADTPGHEEYTRNMAVGASSADLAIILVDAKQGILIQTRRHARICSLMGIKHFVFAVNKMDLVKYNKEKFDAIKEEILNLKNELSLENVQIIPVSATEGDNVTTKSRNTPWYEGPDILTYIENIDVEDDLEEKEFYMPIQRVCRPNHNFRGFQGQVEEGNISKGEEMIILPSNEKALVKSIYVTDKQVESAKKGQSVTIELNKQVDVSRGCVVTKSKNIITSKSLSAKLLWMDDVDLKIGEEYLIKVGTKITSAIITDIKYKINVNTGEHLKATLLKKNEIALCDVWLSEKIVVDSFKSNKTLGELILVDRVTNMTSACGIVDDINNEEMGKNITFKYNGLKASGDIFEEYYYNIENLSIYKKKLSETVYTVGDKIPLRGESYKYPDNLDILVLKDWIEVKVRNKEIVEINTIDKYEYDGYEIVNGSGFKIQISTKEEFEKFLGEYNKKEMKDEQYFWNKWVNFNGYRTVKVNL